MLVVRDDVSGIGGKGTIHEFVVIVVGLYQPPIEIRVDKLKKDTKYTRPFGDLSKRGKTCYGATRMR